MEFRIMQNDDAYELTVAGSIEAKNRDQPRLLDEAFFLLQTSAVIRILVCQQKANLQANIWVCNSGLA